MSDIAVQSSIAGNPGTVSRHLHQIVFGWFTSMALVVLMVLVVIELVRSPPSALR